MTAQSGYKKQVYKKLCHQKWLPSQLLYVSQNKEQLEQRIKFRDKKTSYYQILSWLQSKTLPHKRNSEQFKLSVTLSLPPSCSKTLKDRPLRISRLSTDSPFLSPLLFFCLVLFLSCHFSANGPFSRLLSRKFSKPFH